jgi:RimJ/RimL family protein N-acetyltransferase
LASSSRVRAQLVSRGDKVAVRDYLAASARENLMLIELVDAIGRRRSSGEAPPRVVAAWRGREIFGVASLRPSMAFDHAMTREGLEACLSLLGGFENGLIKSERAGVTRVWSYLAQHGRRAVIDRGEMAYALAAADWREVDPHPDPGVKVRAAVEEDLEELVIAARGSLREEERYDPFEGDPTGFRRWVRGRLQRARVVEQDGRLVFVGYADVRRAEGWLIQGVFTWPEVRRRGFARVGMAGIIDEAFRLGADHVQLSVVEDNRAGAGLYEALGFEAFSELRTIQYC